MQKAVEGNGPYLKSKFKETLGQLHPYVPASHSVSDGWRFVFRGETHPLVSGSAGHRYRVIPAG